MCSSHNDLQDVSNFLQDNFKITIQPKQNFRFRSITELQGSSHGFLKGQQNKTSHPTVKLVLPTNGQLDDHNNKREFYVLCTLHNSNVKCLSSHILLAKGEKSINYKFIFHKMLENVANTLERFWELQNYVIVRIKKDFETAFKCKCSEYRKLKLPMDFETINGKFNLNEDKSVEISGELNVCLGFTIFERDCIDRTFRLYKETIFSDTIYNGNELKIHQLCNLNGSINGGKKITILIKLEPNLPLTILIERINEKTEAPEWSTSITITKSDVFGNHAITFELPPYEGPSCSEDDDEILVYIQVVVTGSTYKSKSAKFFYLIYTDDDNRPRKKARLATQDGASNEPSFELPFPAINPDEVLCLVNDVQMLSPSGSLQDNLWDLDSIFPTNNLGNEFNEDFLINPGEVSQRSVTSRDNILPLNKRKNVIKLKCQELKSEPLELRIKYKMNESNEDILINPDEVSQRSVTSRYEILPVNNRSIIIKQKCPKLKSEPLELRIKNKIEMILKMSEDKKYIDIKGLTNKHDNTIFHEALDIANYFFLFYKMANKSPHKKLVCQARNQYRENLIHYSCVYNRSTYIRPLIGMGCRLYEQDSEGRTPLHTAMEYNHHDCILQIQHLLEDHSEYPQEVVEQLIKMFKVYNHRGLTVLHAAVIDNRLELVQIMLEFCRKYNINVNEYEVLGKGDSLVHLIVEHNLLDMVKFLHRYIPNYLTIENYGGMTALDVPDISKDIQEALNV